MTGEPEHSVCLFGAAPDSGNMGVSALYASSAVGLLRRLPGTRLIVFDNGLGERPSKLLVDERVAVDILRAGARAGRKYHRPENLATMSALAQLGALGGIANRNIRMIDGCDAVLDASGGDSFSDIYGAKRFLSVTRPKLIAIRRKVPLILLPQTYGPYADPKFRALAAQAVRGAAMAWARDAESYDNLKALLGDDFDAERHRSGVDMAFGLEPRDPGDNLAPDMGRLLEVSRATPVIGVNVSGLIHNDPAAAKRQYRLKADYRELIGNLLAWLLANSEARIVLVPHVLTEETNPESDIAASRRVFEALPHEMRARVHLLEDRLDQSETKWLISKLDWFCGTRMHSTIAGLSSGVATTAIAYSDKTRGVFATCGLADSVVDPRALDAGECVEALTKLFMERDAHLKTLRASLPAVKAAADAQMDQITNAIRQSGGGKA